MGGHLLFRGWIPRPEGQGGGRFFFFFQAEDGIRDVAVNGVQTCALPISAASWSGTQAVRSACAGVTVISSMTTPRTKTRGIPPSTNVSRSPFTVPVKGPAPSPESLNRTVFPSEVAVPAPRSTSQNGAPLSIRAATAKAYVPLAFSRSVPPVIRAERPDANTSAGTGTPFAVARRYEPVMVSDPVGPELSPQPTSDARATR